LKIFGNRESVPNTTIAKKINMILRKFQIKNFRSLINVNVKFIDNLPIVISGENNIGKTNFLRALNVYFNHIHDKNLYHAETDIPHHIYYG
ncbi:AAA family ATPase, partial [Neisseria sp. P0015.S004]